MFALIIAGESPVVQIETIPSLVFPVRYHAATRRSRLTNPSASQIDNLELSMMSCIKAAKQRRLPGPRFPEQTDNEFLAAHILFTSRKLLTDLT